MSAFTIFTAIYLIGSIICSLYVVISHIRATSTYFRRLFTAKEINISEIKTYFGWQFNYDDWGDDNWCEVLLMTTTTTLLFTIFTFAAWPSLSLILINKSIEKARKRVQQDS